MDLLHSWGGKKGRLDSSLLKDAKEGASASVAGSLFHVGMVRGEKAVLEAVCRCRVLLIL